MTTRNVSNAFLILLILVVLPVSRLIPPFQSPDEFNHLKRAYLLSRGDVFLGAQDGDTGGSVDTGLLDYMNIFMNIPARYHEKVTQKMLRDSRSITWTHATRFTPLPNTAVYMPLIYTPQATAFFIGEQSGLTVNDTYYLARALSLLATIAILWLAARLYETPLFVYALFALPMTIFQLGSASLDAISFAMCVLVGALFMRASENRCAFSSWMHAALIGLLLLLATARANLIGLIWLPLALYWIRRERLYLVSSALLIVLTLSWTGFAALTVKGTEIQIQDISAGGILSYYLKHLDQLFVVMYTTLTSGTLLLSYWRMFVGVLGWIDTPLDWAVYWMFAVVLVSIAVVSAQTDKRVLLSRGRLALALGAVVSTAFLFVIFLATFSLHPAKFVGAIQGRYFYPMAILLGFVLFDRPLSTTRRTVAAGIVLSTLALSAISMAPKLIERYWANG